MKKRRCALVIATVLLLPTTIAQAQQELIGTYKGSYQTDTLGTKGRGVVTIGLNLEIVSLDDGKVAAKFTQLAGNCRGSYAANGSYKDNVFNLLLAQGELPGCGNFRSVLKVEGGKLVGKYGKQDVEMSK